MSEKERQRCIERIKEDDRDPEPFAWNLDLVKRVLKSWQLYAFCIAWGYVEPGLVISQHPFVNRAPKRNRKDEANQRPVEPWSSPAVSICSGG